MDQSPAADQQPSELERQLIAAERLKVDNEKRKKKLKARSGLKLKLSEKPFVDLRDVRLDLPPKPDAGYSLIQWDEIEDKIVKVFTNCNQLTLPACRLDNYLGILTITHPDLFDEEFHGYVSSKIRF